MKLSRSQPSTGLGTSSSRNQRRLRLKRAAQPCKACHPQIYERWKKTRMATWLLIERTPESDFARLIKTRSLGAFHQRRDDLEDLGRVLEQHQIQPVIDSAFSFEEANAAFNHYAGRKVTGKVVIRH